MLHPELARLQARYNEVLDEHEAGNLSYDDALMTVQAMSVLDGGGYVWMIDPTSGAFLRSVPGEQPVPADPSQFAPASIPSPGSSPWASQHDLMQPPAMASMPTQASPTSNEYAPHHADSNSPYGHIGHSEPTPPRRSALSSLRGRVASISIPPFVEKNKRMLALVAVLAIVLLLVLASGGEDQPDPTITAGTVAPMNTAPVTTTVAPAVAPLLPSVSTEMPTYDDRLQVFTALVSGDRARVTSVLMDTVDPRTLALMTARFKGYTETNIIVVGAKPEPQVVDGVVSSMVSIVDAASGEIYASATATWVLDPSGVWRLQTYPLFE